jgi:shikimate kinase
MIIYLTGVSCVGKTTIGRMLAKKLNYSFFDIDEEIEKYYQKPIERIQDDCIGITKFREMGSKVLDLIISKNGNAVIATTPSGLKYSYYRIYKKYKIEKKIISIHIKDKPENILKRLIFFDKDSMQIEVVMNDLEMKLYKKEIINDYNYFKESFKHADLEINIDGIKLEDIPELIIKKLENIKL